MQQQVQDASTSQGDELKKAQEDLSKAKKEVQALRKQRDAKLAVHERQACFAPLDFIRMSSCALKAHAPEFFALD